MVLSTKKVLVIGDVFLDEFIFGAVSKISPEAPVPVLNKHNIARNIGGAGNVACNIKAMGVPVTLLTSYADDEAGRYLTTSLESMNINVITLPRSHTIVKTRYVGNNQQQIMRCDQETYEETQVPSIYNIENYDAIILSDYNKGCLTVDTIRTIIKQANDNNIPTFVDTKKTNIECFSNAFFIKPNRNELNAIFSPSESVEERASKITNMYNITNCVVTLGDEGAFYVTCNRRGHVRGHKRQVYDVSGAGDTFIAATVVKFTENGDILDSIEYANVAASIAVSKRGTSVVTAAEIQREYNTHIRSSVKISSVEDLVSLVSTWKESNLVVGFTNGCFDILHPGHIDSLESAKTKCDKLIVAINSDTSVKRLKGSSRPIQSEEARAHVLAALGCIDAVCVFDDDTPSHIIEVLTPNKLFKGADYEIADIVGADHVIKHGGTVETTSFKHGFSTSSIINRIKHS